MADMKKAVIQHAQSDMANLPPEPQKVAKQEHRNASGAPSTSSVLWAEWRRGLKDLQNVVLNAFPSHVGQHEEPGTIANPTNVEVYNERHHNQGVEANYEQALSDSANRAPFQNQDKSKDRGR